MNDNNEPIFTEDIWNLWLNSTVEYVFFKDLKGKYLAVSKANARLAGFENAEDMVGKYDCEIYPAEIAQRFLIQDKKVLENKISYSDEDWIEHPALGKILIESVKSPLVNSLGEIIGIQGISRNITDRHILNKRFTEQQSRLTAILNHLPLAVWIKDKENRYVTVNKFYELFYGVTKEQILGQNVTTMLKTHRLFSDEDVRILNEQDNFVLTNNKIKRVEVWVDFDNKKRCLEIIKAPIMSKSEGNIGLIGITHDITGKISLNTNKDEFSTKAKLASDKISAFIQLIASCKLDDEVKNYVNGLKSSLETLNDLFK